MSQTSPLVVFVLDRVLATLREAGELDVDASRHSELVEYCAVELSKAEMGAQLVDSLVRALVDCDFVQELYADNERIKQLITEVGAL